jgi:hypothetical protein
MHIRADAGRAIRHRAMTLHGGVACGVPPYSGGFLAIHSGADWAAGLKVSTQVDTGSLEKSKRSLSVRWIRIR